MKAEPVVRALVDPRQLELFPEGCPPARCRVRAVDAKLASLWCREACEDATGERGPGLRFDADPRAGGAP